MLALLLSNTLGRDHSFHIYPGWSCFNTRRGASATPFQWGALGLELNRSLSSCIIRSRRAPFPHYTPRTPLQPLLLLEMMLLYLVCWMGKMYLCEGFGASTKAKKPPENKIFHHFISSFMRKKGPKSSFLLSPPADIHSFIQPMGKHVISLYTKSSSRHVPWQKDNWVCQGRYNMA